MNLCARVLSASSALLLGLSACSGAVPTSTGSGSSRVTIEGPVTVAEPVRVASPLDVTVTQPVAVAGPVAVEGQVGVLGPVTVQGEVSLKDPVALQQPVAIAAAQPLPALTADTDASRLVMLYGSVTSSTGAVVKVADGPLVVTDVMNTYFYSAKGFRLFVDDGPSCELPGSVPQRILASLPDSAAAVHGARMFVPPGTSLCVHAYDSITLAYYAVSGFRPY